MFDSGSGPGVALEGVVEVRALREGSESSANLHPPMLTYNPLVDLNALVALQKTIFPFHQPGRERSLTAAPLLWASSMKAYGTTLGLQTSAVTHSPTRRGGGVPNQG